MSGVTDNTINVMMFGDGAVGKSSILRSFVQDTFIEEHNETVFETEDITVKLDNNKHRIRLHDTGGQEVYTNLRSSFMKTKHPDVFIVCYSVDSRTSYDNVTNTWIQEIRNGAPIILVATKTDLRIRLNHISHFEGVSLQKRIGAKAFIECSSRNQTNIDEVFFQAIKATLPIVQNPSNSSWLIVQFKKICCC